ncbi:sigma-70 family RNA polymerase sigma factor [Flavobacteriaceae bacterium F89]|uniref:Sigma-70 family RNA polymerase sigma factor n=1 Tax=Cerina litoralis TaxID=2874477 RepID=A0AAE3EWW0_9FLAO|nr:sigma-70 family RNA polymerase sigma factor [Cerina litoralis]MCG2461604.1 sigma-70 family RNA polymerase sigma factor [Cerina litoralis]
MEEHHKFLESLFRAEYGKIIAVLTNRFGPSKIESIEDCVQDALLKAMKIWGYKNVPDNPTAWLLRVAGNNLIDQFRRDKKMEYGKDDYIKEKGIHPQEIYLKSTITDSQLKMIFACCHPSLSAEYQIILSLKLIGGFGNSEIAQALIKKEEAVAKSYTRAKKQLKATVSTLDIPLEMGLRSRLNIVLKVIYLMFSEGYAASSGDIAIKKDICLEAIRLARLLEVNKYCDLPEVHALVALMCFHTSRFEARTDINGELVDMEHQDRKKYDKNLINIGVRYLERATTPPISPSTYHLEAAVSYNHCRAKTFGETDWKSILHLYDLQMQTQFSPIVQLNRVVPYYMVHGAEAGLKELRDYETSSYFIDSVLYYAIKAEILVRLEDNKGAKTALENAIGHTKNKVEKRHLLKKLRNNSSSII